MSYNSVEFQTAKNVYIYSSHVPGDPQLLVCRQADIYSIIWKQHARLHDSTRQQTSDCEERLKKKLTVIHRYSSRTFSHICSTTNSVYLSHRQDKKNAACAFPWHSAVIQKILLAQQAALSDSHFSVSMTGRTMLLKGPLLWHVVGLWSGIRVFTPKRGTREFTVFCSIYYHACPTPT